MGIGSNLSFVAMYHLTCRAPSGYHYTRLTPFGRVFLPVVALCAVDNYELWTEAQRLAYLASQR